MGGAQTDRKRVVLGKRVDHKRHRIIKKKKKIIKIKKKQGERWHLCLLPTHILKFCIYTVYTKIYLFFSDIQHVESGGSTVTPMSNGSFNRSILLLNYF